MAGRVTSLNLVSASGIVDRREADMKGRIRPASLASSAVGLVLKRRIPSAAGRFRRPH
jgi:hypothetical protein